MTYVYERADGQRFEAEQRMSDDPLTECPETGLPCFRVITGGGGLKLPYHMMADGSKAKHNPDMLPTTTRDWQNKVFKPEYRPGNE